MYKSVKYYILLLVSLSSWSKLAAVDDGPSRLTREVSGEYSTSPLVVIGGTRLDLAALEAPPARGPVLRRFNAYVYDSDPNASGDTELMRVIRNGPQAEGNWLPGADALISNIRILALTEDPSQPNDASDTAFSLLERKDWPLDVKAEILNILLARQAALSISLVPEGSDDVD